VSRLINLAAAFPAWNATPWIPAPRCWSALPICWNKTCPTDGARTREAGKSLQTACDRSA